MIAVPDWQAGSGITDRDRGQPDLGLPSLLQPPGEWEPGQPGRFCIPGDPEHHHAGAGMAGPLAHAAQVTGLERSIVTASFRFKGVAVSPGVDSFQDRSQL